MRRPRIWLYFSSDSSASIAYRRFSVLLRSFRFQTVALIKPLPNHLKIGHTFFLKILVFFHPYASSYNISPFAVQYPITYRSPRQNMSHQNSSLVSQGIVPPILLKLSNVPSPILTELNLIIRGSKPKVFLTSSCILLDASYLMMK